MKHICGTENPSVEEQIEINRQLSLYKTSKSTKTTPLLIPVCIYIKSSPIIGTEITDFIKSLNDYYKGTDINYDSNKDFFKDKVFDYDPQKQILLNDIKTQYNNFYDLKNNINVHFYLKSVVTEAKIVNPGLHSDNSIADLDIIIKQKIVGTSIVYDVPEQNYLKTLNIWVVEFITSPTNFILYGYSTWPWNVSVSPQYDGIVIDKRTIKPSGYDTRKELNKTTVHELGHWFGLLHTFQIYTVNGIDYGDNINDTPPQINPTYGNPLEPRRPSETVDPTSWPVNSNKLSMFINYMDYSDDSCVCMFTSGQCNKINEHNVYYRKGLKNYIELTNPTITISITNYNNLRPVYYFNNTSNIRLIYNFIDMNNGFPNIINVLKNDQILSDTLYTISDNIITLASINTSTVRFKIQIQDIFSNVYSNEIVLNYVDNYIPLTSPTITISIKNYKKIGSTYYVNNKSSISLTHNFSNMNGDLPNSLKLLRNNINAPNNLYTISNNKIILISNNTTKGTFKLQIQDSFSTVYSNSITLKYLDIPTVLNIKLVRGVLKGTIINPDKKLVTVNISVRNKKYTVKTYKYIRCSVITAKLIKKRKYAFKIKTNNSIFTFSKSIILTY